MADKSTEAKSGGIGFVGLLTILFIALKLIGVINWSWWWILSPVWISIGLLLSVLIFASLLWLIFDYLDKREKRINAPPPD